MRVITILSLCFVAVTADSESIQSSTRVVGGRLTTIERWPYQALVLIISDNSVWPWCGGAIINNRSVLSAAHCILLTGHYIPTNLLRLRLGSSFASSGGFVHSIARNIFHPNYNPWTRDNDVMIMQSSTIIIYSNVVQRGTIASPIYNLLDNQVVWVAGWGDTETAFRSEQIHEVQVYTINQATCAQRYGGNIITANMLCTGVLNVGGRDACQGDSGSPVYHNRVIVGINSFGRECASPFFPRVNTRVASYSPWIVANA